MRGILACLISAGLFVGARAGAQAPNLLANPGFEQGTEGWSPFWTREAGQGEMALDNSAKHADSRSLRVTHRGKQDWSVAQNARVPVKPGDVLRISGWVKCEACESAQLSVVTADAAGKTLDWMAGLVDTRGTHDWKRLSRRCVVPPGCANVQFRFTGTGSGTVWLDDASLTKEGSVEEAQAKLRGKTLRLTNRMLDARLDAARGTLVVTDRRNGRAWEQRAVEAGVIVRKAEASSKAAARLELWDVANDLTLTADIMLAADRPEMTVALSGEGALGPATSWPQPFVTAKGTWLIVPMNEGILYPVDDASIPAMQLAAYSGHGICMPWYGAIDPKSGAGVMTILNTPDDARIEITRQGESTLYIRPQWEAQRGQLGYARKLTYVFTDRGGYVAQAKRYRAYAKQTGLFKTLSDKRKANPNIDLLIGAANIWNWDMDKVALCREMKSLGMDRILWSSGGSPEQLAEINKLGYLTGRYDIFQDVYPPDAPQGWLHAGWPEDLVLLPNGEWMRGWETHEKQPDGTMKVTAGGVICSSRQLPRAKQTIPADLATHPYKARFIDTTTASPWRECYNPAHPLTRSEDRRWKMALLEYCSKDEKQVTGTETGIDPSVPYVDYYEGMLSLGPYRLPDAGRDMEQYKPPTPDFLKFQVGFYYRIPLWELVYHDCTVSTWYWGDYNNKAPEVWERRDQFNRLYGTPPMYMFNRKTWEQDRARFAESYKAICPLVRKLGYDEMVSHEFLTPDHSVQRTRWRSGAVVTETFK